MKIIFLMQQMITGGIENCLLQILRSIKDNPKYKITILSGTPVTEQSFLDFFSENHIRLIDTDFFKYERMSRPTNFFKRKTMYFMRWLNRRKLHRLFHQQDLIIDYFNGSMTRYLPHNKIPRIAFLHCSIDAYTSNPNHIKDMNKYDKIVCISQSFYNDITKMYPDKKSKFTMIYNPVDMIRIRERCVSCNITPPSGKYFVSVARLHTDKDHETLLQGFKKFLVNENFPDVKLYLCGDGPLRQQWENLARELNIDENIVFLGNTANPFVYVRGAMAHILSSFGEGLPTVLIEAQTLGALNIASDVKSGIREILMDGAAGVLFYPGNPDDLAKKMSMIYNNELDVDSMQQNATDGLKRFDANKICAELNTLFLSHKK